jgi:hypothetical protein
MASRGRIRRRPRTGTCRCTRRPSARTRRQSRRA